MVSPGPADDLERELAVLLRRARGISGQLARDLHPELEPGAYGLLVRLSTTGGARATDLAAYLGIGKPTVSRQLAALEQLGMVVRERDADDARAQQVRLTADGRERLERVREVRREHVLGELASWSDEDVVTLAGLLGRYNALAEPALADPGPAASAAP